ncbi:unnamed protein product [Lactuca virosa]|uniref:Uncharacterized protein n=1 Tax=Lactuca virosa TaxID=75947 RepID=A0AAU9M7Z4_9ASTR|nr:unnamed protein product [Lactuca virosa]
MLQSLLPPHPSTISHLSSLQTISKKKMSHLEKQVTAIIGSCWKANGPSFDKLPANRWKIKNQIVKDLIFGGDEKKHSFQVGLVDTLHIIIVKQVLWAPSLAWPKTLWTPITEHNSAVKV